LTGPKIEVGYGMISKTPKTDAALIDNADLSEWGYGKSNYVDADFARQFEEALANLLVNPYPHDLMAIRIEVERDWGGDEAAAQEEMSTYCTQEMMLEARQKWKSAEDAARKLLNP